MSELEVTKIEIPLENLEIPNILCCSENRQAPDNYGEAQFHPQKPLSIIINYIHTKTYYKLNRYTPPVETVHPYVLVKAECQHCHEINHYQLGIFKIRSKSSQESTGSEVE